MKDQIMPADAIVLSHGVYRQTYGKVAHGLVRGSDRFRVLVVVDPEAAGEDAGELLDGRRRRLAGRGCRGRAGLSLRLRPPPPIKTISRWRQRESNPRCCQ